MVEEIVKENISGYYLWFLPKTNFLFYPKNKIKNELAIKFKRLNDIALSLEDLKTLVVSTNEHLASYTWCGPTPEEKTKCYFMDEQGYIFDEAPYFSGEVYLKFYGKYNINESDPSGSYFFQPNFNKLISFKDAMEKIGVKPAAFYIAENGDIKMSLSSNKQNGGEIIWKTDSDFDKVLENLQTVLTTEPLQTEFKNKYSSLLYIDLRFGNKVYYKFR